MAETIEAVEEAIEEATSKRKLGKKILIGVAATTAVVGGVLFLASRKGVSEVVDETISE